MKEALQAFALRFTPPAALAGGSFAIPSLTGSADAFLAATLAEGAGGEQKGEDKSHETRDKRQAEGQETRDKSRVVLAVTPGLPDADRLTDDLKVLTADTPIRVLEFPPSLEGDKSALGLRIKTIAALKAWELNPYPCIVVAAYPALATPIKTGTDPLHLTLPTGSVPSSPMGSVPSSKAVNFAFLTDKLQKLGYERLPQVEKEGDYSVRGGIVDIWNPGDEFPIRAEFFGDDLESLRTFDPATQISVERIDSAEILPIEEGEGQGEGGGGESGGKGTLFGLLPEDSMTIALEHNAYNLDSASSPKLTAKRQPLTAVFTGDPAPRGVPTYNFQTVTLPGFAELAADEAHHPELFDTARQRLNQHIAAAEKRGDRIFKADELSGGFEVGAGATGGGQETGDRIRGGREDKRRETRGSLIVVTKADRVFTKKTRLVRSRGATHPGGARLNDFDDLEPGEYVVHIDYGVGRYVGSSEIVVDGRRSEVFTIEYADGGKLHVPAAHAHLLSRYVGVKGEAVRLHRLDGKRWTQDKRDAQKAVSDLAATLLETQAKRDTVPGFAYDIHCEGREAFDAAFPYEETTDQLAAIAAIEQDLARTRPMDRLICGDAGYGKTEVAMRAAFIAAMNGKQVAVLAPTTVLAEQHFETFTSRFDGTPVRIESVSRFQSAATHAGTFKRLATGVCDIVIGTHAILSNKIAFHDLGLVIIDEEQRFGVRHKEFLKRLRATADVLTLSATPIPRTLYLSMTGARDLSLLRSPPRERVAVETRIVRDSDEIIRSAIESELARGGQVFFLHNRVTTIGHVEKRLKELFQAHNCPRIVVAHGQMDARTLALKMRDFERGAYDILLSTTIVESGIDIPRANTILVDKAENFGMADLYQLRGRVGRSSRPGFAYFLLPPSGDIDSDARERLTALKRHGGLGTGFSLAVRDLELRGAGNLLGSQQSGHIAAVGFGLYCQLLQRTIALMKGERVKDVVDVQINLDFVNPRIPFSYIEEDVQRLSLMKRFAEAQDEKTVKALKSEMKDRFGPLPPEAEEYVRIALLRAACAAHGITHIDAKGSRAVLYKTGSREIYKVIDLKGPTAEKKIAEIKRGL